MSVRYCPICDIAECATHRPVAAPDPQDARISELETLLARNLVFDHGSAEEGVEALGGWANMVARVEAYREENP